MDNVELVMNLISKKVIFLTYLLMADRKYFDLKILIKR